MSAWTEINEPTQAEWRDWVKVFHKPEPNPLNLWLFNAMRNVATEPQAQMLQGLNLYACPCCCHMNPQPFGHSFLAGLLGGGR